MSLTCIKFRCFKNRKKGKHDISPIYSDVLKVEKRRETFEYIGEISYIQEE
jgi:hypothetical protein